MARIIPSKKKASAKKSPKKIKGEDSIESIVKNQWSLEQLEGIIFNVNASKSSVFAKEDVLSILKEVKEVLVNRKDAPKIDMETFIDEIAENVCDNVCEDDLDTFGLELDGTSIYIDMIRLDGDKIREYVSDIVTSYL
jgi:hypothetical protein